MSLTARQMLLPTVVALSLLFVAAERPAAVAGPPSAASPGKWSGTLMSRSGSPINGAKVRFRVKGSKVTKFTVDGAPVNCNYNPLDPTGWTLELRTIEVPSAKIRGKAFRRVYEIEKGGRTLGTTTLKGRFSARKRASGTLKYKSGACLGDYRFSAARK